MSVKQLIHQNTHNKKLARNIRILCDDIRTPENLGMIFRVAEAFGVELIYLTSNCPDSSNIKVRKTSRSTIDRIKSIVIDDKSELLTDLKDKDYRLIGVEITNTSKRIQELDLKPESKIILVIGSERNGITKEVLSNLDECYHIEMFGENSSMNVVNALSISLYEIQRANS